MTLSSKNRMALADLKAAIEQLRALVAIPSLSNPHNPDYDPRHLQEAADFVTDALKKTGFETQQISIEGSAPFVWGEKIIDPQKPTILCYAHYDVQPVMRKNWKTDPFMLTEKEGRLYGRGSSDDKAGVIAILTALGICQKGGSELPCNVRILFEGEEEYGSSHMGQLIEQEKERFKADALVVMDGGNKTVDAGSLTTSVRGLVNFKLEVRTMEKPVHSGIGCLVPDPALILAELMVSLKDPRKIPGFMETCKPLEREERKLFAEQSQTAEEYAENRELFEGALLRGDPKKSVYERIVEEPSISFPNGAWGLPNGGNSIQDSASCQIGVRITAGQDPEQIAKVLIEYLYSQNRQGAKISLEVQETCFAWKGDISKPLTRKYIEALGENFAETHIQPTGGALPFLRDFQKFYPQMEIIIPGVEDPKTAAHSHNESQDTGLFEKAILALVNFLKKAGSVEE